MLLAHGPQLCADRGVALARRTDRIDQQIALAQEQRPESREQLAAERGRRSCRSVCGNQPDTSQSDTSRR